MSDTKACAAMRPLGEIDGKTCFWAEPGLFERPGFYYWDGKANVHVPFPPPAPGPMLEAMAKAAFEVVARRGFALIPGLPPMAWETEPEELRQDWRDCIRVAMLKLKDIWGPRAADPFGDKAQIVVDEVLR